MVPIRSVLTWGAHWVGLALTSALIGCSTGSPTSLSSSSSPVGLTSGSEGSGAFYLTSEAESAVLPAPQAGYQITLKFNSRMSDSRKQTFKNSAKRWGQIITGDIPNVNLSGVGLVDDLYIEASIIPIDGRGGILGQAGPNSIRNGSFLPISGIMQFDSADVADLEAAGQFQAVILHEMGHVIGIGTIWDLKGLLTGTGGSDPRFTGPRATNRFNEIFGGTATSVPVENTGGGGTRDSHWRESVFFNELMTGFLNGGISNPISRVTVASLGDLGYAININKAGNYVPPAALKANEAPVSGRIPVLKLPLNIVEVN